MNFFRWIEVGFEADFRMNFDFFVLDFSSKNLDLDFEAVLDFDYSEAEIDFYLQIIDF